MAASTAAAHVTRRADGLSARPSRRTRVGNDTPTVYETAFSFGPNRPTTSTKMIDLLRRTHDRHRTTHPPLRIVRVATTSATEIAHRRRQYCMSYCVLRRGLDVRGGHIQRGWFCVGAHRAHMKNELSRCRIRAWKTCRFERPCSCSCSSWCSHAL